MKMEHWLKEKTFDGYYCRVSSDDGTQTLLTQENIAMAVIEKNEFDFKIYKDEGTGTNTNRDDYQLLLSDIKLGNMRRLYVERMDRLNRSFYEGIEILRLCEETNTIIYSIEEGFTSEGNFSKIMAAMLFGAAEIGKKAIATAQAEWYKQAKIRGGGKVLEQSGPRNRIHSVLTKKTLDEIRHLHLANVAPKYIYSVLQISRASFYDGLDILGLIPWGSKRNKSGKKKPALVEE